MKRNMNVEILFVILFLLSFIFRITLSGHTYVHKLIVAVRGKGEEGAEDDGEVKLLVVCYGLHLHC